MLVLTRQQNETIIIGDDIIITVCGIRGDKVRIGISAPNHINIRREELVNKTEIEAVKQRIIG